MTLRAFAILLNGLAAAALLSASSTRVDALQRNTSDAGDAPSDGPVGKVVKLLEDMRVELLNEKERDQELYDKLSCWCEATIGSKQTAIESGTAAMDRLAADIQAKASKTYQLKPEIKFLKEDLADSEKSLRESEEMRSTERAEFAKNEKELASAITSLTGAVAAMAKAHPSFLDAGRRAVMAFLQEALTEANGSLQRSLAALPPRLLWHAGLTEVQKGELNAFLQHKSPGSEVVFGILKQMKETFETNLADAQASEAESSADFLKLKASKSKELNAGRQNLAAKEQDLAATTEEMAAAEQSRDDTEATLAADTKALLSAKKRCKAADEEFEERHKSRTEELAAISDTVALLSSPDSANIFGKTVETFLQVRQETNRRAAARALQRLRTGSRSGRRALAAVAAQVRGLDALDKVKEGVDRMITELELQQKDHAAKKAECETQLEENAAATDATEQDLKDLDTEVATLEETLEELNDDLAGLEAELNETQGEIAKAGEDRAEENADFNNAVANQHAAQQVLQLAINRMELVYDLLQTDRPLSLLQTPNRTVARPLSLAAARSKGGGPVQMLKEIIEDSKAMVRDAEATEKKSQEAYSEFVEDCNGALKVIFASITDKKMKRGRSEAELIQKKEAQSSATNELADLKKQADTLEEACGSLVKNFDTVHEARAGEIDALRQAMDILSEAA